MSKKRKPKQIKYAKFNVFLCVKEETNLEDLTDELHGGISCLENGEAYNVICVDRVELVNVGGVFGKEKEKRFLLIPCIVMNVCDFCCFSAVTCNKQCTIDGSKFGKNYCREVKA